LSDAILLRCESLLLAHGRKIPALPNWAACWGATAIGALACAPRSGSHRDRRPAAPLRRHPRYRVLPLRRSAESRAVAISPIGARRNIIALRRSYIAHLRRPWRATSATVSCLPEPSVEPVPADISGASQHLVDGTNAPTSPVAGTDACCVQVVGDRFHPHRTGRAVALACKAEDQPDRLRLDGIDFQSLLGAVSVLLAGLDDVITKSAEASRSRTSGGRSPWTGTRRIAP
jgi:hypothetical protein